jgi:hypothetical protein
MYDQIISISFVFFKEVIRLVELIFLEGDLFINVHLFFLGLEGSLRVLKVNFAGKDSCNQFLEAMTHEKICSI